MIGVILLIVAFEYRELLGEEELSYAFNLRTSRYNVLWFNTLINGKQRQR
jgi:hypothetical protein